MARRSCFVFLSVLFCLASGLSAMAQFNPPPQLTRQDIVAASQQVLAMPDLKIKVKEDIWRFRILEMDWDGAGRVYEPEDTSKIPVLPNGKKVGMFLIHGGSGDHRGMDQAARFLCQKFGFKVVTMSYPGSLYLLNESHDWPGESLSADGKTARVPMWNKDIPITADQYTIVEDKSMRPKYGTLILACAKEGTEFYNRKAGWPVAFEEVGKTLMHKYLPANDFSIYIHGHSTGGPFSFMFSQRVENIAGVIGMDSSPFGYIFRKQARESGNASGRTYGDLPFNCLQIRTWRDRARYAGVEALMTEGPDALKRLPMLMEEVFESAKNGGTTPQFKSEGMVHYGSVEPLTEAAKATAKRLKMNPQQTQALIAQYIGYSRELSGPGVRPVPPVIIGCAGASADHLPERYKTITLPMFAAMKPAPKVSLVEFKAGVHGYTRPEADLPMGTFPAVVKLWRDAILGGYFTSK